MTRLPANLERAIRDRYGDRPEKLAEVIANAEAWERLKLVAEREEAASDGS